MFALTVPTSLPPSPGVVLYGIPLLAVGVAALFLWAVARVSSGRTTAVLGALTVAWMTLTAGLAHAGVLLRFDLRPPPMLLLMICLFGLGIGIGVSRLGARLAALPAATLVLAQAFRLPLELVMHEAAASGVMPHVLSFSGYNFDVLTGALAIPVGLALRANPARRGLLMLWNALGSVCLIVIAFIALASSPLVMLWGAQSLNLWVLHFPYVWLPAVMVLFAVAGHAVVWRKLLTARTARSGTPASQAESATAE